MHSWTLNSEESLQRFVGEIRELWKARKFLTIDAHEGKKRSLDQNAMSHAWYAQISRELREHDAVGVKRECKLLYGVPILRAEDKKFRDTYNRVILRALSYEQKILAMDILPVTSRMTTKQLKQYTDKIQEVYRDRGVVLEYPPEQ